MQNQEGFISIQELSKTFGKFRALEKINLSINAGEIFGILGLNAAGKTTLLRCLVNFLKPDILKGPIFFKSNPLTEKETHNYFGYLPEDFHPPLNLSAEELLTFLSSNSDSKLPVKTCLEMVGLFEEKSKKIKTYSRGMIQRLGLAIALLKDPQVIILDEPILGLDLAGQRHIFSLLKTLNHKGKTIILSTHIFPYIEKFCHRIGVIHKGKLRFTGSIEDFLAKQNTASLEDAFLKEVGI